MGSEWDEYTLGDLGKIVTGKTPSKREAGNFGDDIPFITPRDLNGRRAIDQTERYLSGKGASSVKNAVIPANSIAVSCIGSDMGKAAIVKNESVTNQQINSIILNDGFDYQYVYYVLSTRKQEIRDAAGGSAQPILNKTHFSQLPIVLPPLPEQKAIAHILGSLDDKIELNRKMNATLEAMAQALFKSWFVDFDPIIDNILTKNMAEDSSLGEPSPSLSQRERNVSSSSPSGRSGDEGALRETLFKDIPEALIPRAEIRRKVQQEQPELFNRYAELFPSAFIETDELGPIPEGWKAAKLGDYLEIKRGGSPRPIHDFLRPEGLPWVKIADATASPSRFLFQTKEFIKPEGLKKTVLLKKGSLILSNSATPGLPMVLQLDACIHDGWLHFPEIKHFSQHYLYQLFLVIREELVGRGNGSVFTNLKTDILRAQNITVPPNEVLKKFDDWMEPTFGRLLSINIEIQNLTKLRDTLLPKLISGDIMLSSAEFKDE